MAGWRAALGGEMLGLDGTVSMDVDEGWNECFSSSMVVLLALFDPYCVPTTLDFGEWTFTYLGI